MILDSEMYQQEGESRPEYELRLGVGKLNKTPPYCNYNWGEICEILNIEGTTRVFRGKMYGAKQAMEVMADRSEKDCPTDVMTKIELEKAKVKAEKVKVSTLRLEINRLIRENARKELYLEEVERCVKTLQPFEIPKVISETGGETTMLVSVSDAHVGKITEVIGLEGELINKYDFDVFKDRMATLYSKIVQIAKKENVGKIVVLALGDNVDGILRQSQLQSIQFGIVDSVLEYSEYISTWLNELSKEGVFIEYHSAYGNHASLRILNAKSSKDFPNENVEKIIDKFIETRLANNSNIKVFNNGMPFSYLTVAGVNILATHGEEKNLVTTLKDFRAMYKKDIHMIIAGHLHSNKKEDVGVGDYGNMEVIRVPSICGADDYSMTLHKMSRPGSTALIFEKGSGKTIEYSIYL